MSATLNTNEAKFSDLKTCLCQIKDLEAAASVLNWDQTTLMPPGGAAARGRQIATLKQIAHEKLIDPTIGQILEDLRPYEQSLPHDSPEAAPLSGGPERLRSLLPYPFGIYGPIISTSGGYL